MYVQRHLMIWCYMYSLAMISCPLIIPHDSAILVCYYNDWTIPYNSTNCVYTYNFIYALLKLTDIVWVYSKVMIACGGNRGTVAALHHQGWPILCLLVAWVAAISQMLGGPTILWHRKWRLLRTIWGQLWLEMAETAVVLQLMSLFFGCGSFFRKSDSEPEHFTLATLMQISGA